MKTAILKEIEDKQVITGWSDAQIDPVNTARAILPFLEDTEERKAIKSKAKEIGERQRMARQAMLDAVRYAKSGQVQKQREKEKEYQAHNILIEQLMNEAKSLKEPFEKKRRELIEQHAIYFRPRAGEVFLSDEEFEKLFSIEIPDYHWLSISGDLIPDYSGQTIYKKTSSRWNIISVPFGNALPAGAILQKDLTDEQHEEIAEQNELDRIKSLSTTEKTEEMDLKKIDISAQAAQMKNELEIQGDKQALKKSQDWYKKEIEIIEARYK